MGRIATKINKLVLKKKLKKLVTVILVYRLIGSLLSFLLQ